MSIPPSLNPHGRSTASTEAERRAQGRDTTMSDFQINAKTKNVSPEGWGPVEDPPDFDSSNVHFWEHNTTDMSGKPVDVSQRHPIVRQLTLPKDAATIANCRNPEFVLGGWKPVVEN